MSESATSLRPTIDIDAFERRLNAAASVPTPLEVQFADLTRLVDGEDPFKSVFAAPRAPAQRAAPPIDMPAAMGGPNKPFAWPGQPGPRPALPEEDVPVSGEAYPEPMAAYAPPVAHDPASRDEWMAAEEFAATGQDDVAAPAPARRAPRRTLIALGAVVAMVGAAVAGALMLKGGATTGAKGAPTIMAANGPTKVQPDNPGGVDVPNQDASILDKSKPDNIAASRVVSSGEQPVDVTQNRATGPALGTGPVVAPAGNNLFPEPKRVKTVVVRPDGSVVPNDTAAAAAQPVIPSQAPRSAPVANAATGAKPSTPKATQRVATTPRSDAPSAQPADAAPAVKRPPVATARPAPVETADAGDATAPAGKGGAYSVQLAAPGSEQEARDVSSRLQKKFSSELGGLKPAVRKADVGDKSIYRVRVGNLSQDDAKALCVKLQASGGTCFVARN